ncbi:hypothetical protein RUND412_008641 [Rhizina undulata]
MSASSQQWQSHIHHIMLMVESFRQQFPIDQYLTIPLNNVPGRRPLFLTVQSVWSEGPGLVVPVYFEQMDWTRTEQSGPRTTNPGLVHSGLGLDETLVEFLGI